MELCNEGFPFEERLAEDGFWAEDPRLTPGALNHKKLLEILIMLNLIKCLRVAGLFLLCFVVGCYKFI